MLPLARFVQSQLGDHPVPCSAAKSAQLEGLGRNSYVPNWDEGEKGDRERSPALGQPEGWRGRTGYREGRGETSLCSPVQDTKTAPLRSLPPQYR